MFKYSAKTHEKARLAFGYLKSTDIKLDLFLVIIKYQFTSVLKDTCSF